MKLPIKILCPDCDDTVEIPFDTLRNHRESAKCYCGEWQVEFKGGKVEIQKWEEP